jgi:hypothetical protein
MTVGPPIFLGATGMVAPGHYAAAAVDEMSRDQRRASA